MQPPTDPAELAQLAERVAALRREHRELDDTIARMQADIAADELAVKRLKKRKLQLKDLIAKLESALIPDEPA
ncbi:MAG TPA: YdcH family protein [Luteimonas sp.]|uniref:YdcH family protein n=1 Tax=Xenophilus sp. TaxID=1873499 RepID=UPI002BA28F4D|nr:YdcH family protein [Luteimonas sp.]